LPRKDLAEISGDFMQHWDLLLIFKDTASGCKYQESRGGLDLDEITRAFRERMKKGSSLKYDFFQQSSAEGGEIDHG
jgi:hypothetical protein